MREEDFSPEGEQEPPEFTSAHAVLWMTGAFLLMIFTGSLLHGLRPQVAQDLVSLGILSAAVFLFVSALLLGRYPGGRVWTAAVGLRPVPWTLVALGALWGVSAQLPADRLRRWTEWLLPVSPERAVAQLQMLEPQSLLHAVWLVVVAALLVPWAEEVFFRGAVFGALRRSGRSAWVAAWVTGLGFTFSHFDLRLWPAILLVAATLGAQRVLSGSLLPGLAFHIAFNGVTMAGAVARFFAGEPLEVQAVPLGVEWLGLVAFVLFGFLFVKLSLRSSQAQRNRIKEMSVE